MLITPPFSFGLRLSSRYLSFSARRGGPPFSINILSNLPHTKSPYLILEKAP